MVPQVIQHPHEDVDYTLLDDGTIRVRDHTAGLEGVFRLGGVWVEGDLRHADAHMIRWCVDATAPSRAVAPAIRVEG